MFAWGHDFLQQRIRIGIARFFVITLDQQPLMLLALHVGAHQLPAALEPAPMQDEVHFPSGDRLQRVAIAGPGAVVVHIHMAGAIVAFGDVASNVA